VDVSAGRLAHSRVRILTHIKKLDDSFGQFLVRVSCVCGATRHVQPVALAACRKGQSYVQPGRVRLVPSAATADRARAGYDP